MWGAVLRQPNTKAALVQAFGRIKATGEEPRYQRGYWQFLKFMDAAATPAAEAPADATIDRLFDLLGQRSRTKVRMATLERGDNVLLSVPLRPAPCKLIAHDALAGSYRLSLDTGWVLWEGAIGEKQLLWRAAFPDQPLRAAADTGEPGPQPTMELRLLDGTLVLRVYAGLEAGSIELELKSKGAVDQ